jgi:hypothetical protein
VVLSVHLSQSNVKFEFFTVWLQVLWVSSDGLPDLGGIPEDEPCFADEVQQPALTYPGAYRSISIELKVHHLAVNALLKSSQVNEMEGGALLGFSSDVQDAAGAVGVQTSWDETVSCAPAFQVLKHMVQGWLSDAVSSGNVFADCLLQHLYRWLCRCTPQIPGVFSFFLTCIKEMSFSFPFFVFVFVSDLVERCYS